MKFWELSRTQRGQLVSLMDQQLWCWGQDIEHREGNMLLEYGFTRIRTSEAQKACSQYSLSLGKDRTLRLWGYGIAYLTAFEDCYFSRAAFCPALFKAQLPESVFSNDELPPLKYSLTTPEQQRCQGYLATVLCEIASYESWLEDHLGTEYRETILVKRKHRLDRHRETVQEWSELFVNDSSRVAITV